LKTTCKDQNINQFYIENNLQSWQHQAILHLKNNYQSSWHQAVLK
jgi:hypothetical protein